MHIKRGCHRIGLALMLICFLPALFVFGSMVFNLIYATSEAITFADTAAQGVKANQLDAMFWAAAGLCLYGAMRALGWLLTGFASNR